MNRIKIKFKKHDLPNPASRSLKACDFLLEGCLVAEGEDIFSHWAGKRPVDDRPVEVGGFNTEDAVDRFSGTGDGSGVAMRSGRGSFSSSAQIDARELFSGRPL